MSTQLEIVEARALKLTAEERAQLADRLIASLFGDYETEAMTAGEVEQLTAQKRVEFIGHLWDSLDPAVAAPMTPELASELDRREAEADADPEAGQPWAEIKNELAGKRR